MSGHSKWSQIKHRKAITDAKRGQIFGKVARELTIAARGNPDPKTNYRLTQVIDKARSLNMPQDNIDRAIKRVSERNSAELQELQLEAIGPGGAALIIHAITNSRNRTLNELKILLSRLNVKSVPPNSLAWMMNSPVVLSKEDQERLESIIETLDDHDDVQEITTNAQ